MSKIDKVGDFSRRYHYARADSGEYYLFPKGRNGDPTPLQGAYVPQGRPLARSEVRLFSFSITPLRLAAYLILCTLGSALLAQLTLVPVIILWSANLHELSHILVAVCVGSRKMVFGVKIKYAIFPMAYVSNRTIYERSKSARVCYYCAGIVANFVLACAFYAVPWSKIDPELVATAHLALVVNAVLFFFNLYPFLFTDGFNVLREVLEVYNLREIVVRGFFRPRQILASSRAAFGYYIFLLLSMGVLAFRFASWIVALGR